MAAPVTPRKPYSAINPSIAKLSLNDAPVASPTPSHLGAGSPPGSPSPSSPSPPSDDEEITYEEAKRRADERAAAALQCSIDNKEACMACSG
jgi:hypothetical protein